MQPPTAVQDLSRIFRKVFLAALLLCLATSGCNNSCYSGFWNGNGSGVAAGNTSCPLTPATGNVAMQMGAASVSSAASTTSAVFASVPSPRDIQHLYITLRAIDAHASSTADNAASGWQQLAPALAPNPLQVDLLALNTESPSSAPSTSAIAPTALSANIPATIPAEEYRQLRLQLMARHPSPEEVIPERNDCGNVGWSCVVFADGSVRPLEFGGAAPEIRITPAHSAENLFRVLPDENVRLSIQFDARSSSFFSSNTADDTASNAAVQMVPVFKVVVLTP
jgi:hypothetical protein